MNADTTVSPIRPTISAVNRPFWEGCARGVLTIQRCIPCGHLRYPAGPVCPRCLSAASTWYPVSGRGSVFSFVVFHRAYHPAWKDRTPYNVCLIELEEGPMMLSNVVGIENAALTVGQPVVVAFQSLDETLAIPVFQRA